MSRFVEMSDDCIDLINKTIDENFDHLKGAKFSFVYDTKKRRSGGRFVIGKLAKANDIIKHISADDLLPDGVDYIFIVDKQVFDVLSNEDKVRIVRHTLQYAEVDYDGKNPFKIRQAEIQTFYEEIEFNKNDPEWMERINDIASSIYDTDE